MAIPDAIYTGILTYMQGGVVVIDLQGTVRAFNPAAERMLGLAARSTLRQPFAAYFFENPANDTFAQAVLDAIYDPNTQHTRDLTFHRDDGVSWLNVITSFLWSPADADGPSRKIGVVALFVDITERKKAEANLQRINDQLEQRVRARTSDLAAINRELQHEIDERTIAQRRLAYLAEHDALTGLPNRRLLEQRLTRALVSLPHFAVAYLDLDNFKIVNDAYGHDVGDWLLSAVAGRLEECLGPEDLPARLGGDEFAIFLSDASAAEATVSQVVERLSQPYRRADGTTLDIGVSAGIALHPEGGRTVRSLIQSADAAMYRSKRSSRR
ncbi:diguanylate cyclase [Ancylobacter sp. MQZ15Z-1]|uniref:Diguanylate cyclase n=1 Tax=Ancylobacter mangrovi TaxID=2972472 RepID=A0A9X2PFJ1_9HYPH|nr:diguanylate cyclase [Ancylobacter mangrovi]MCS0497832.1 diguanylate cyclase [Ancylobacter mangrovi]